MVFDDLLNVLGHGRADGELLYTTIIRSRTERSWKDAWLSIRERTTFGDISINTVMFHYVPHLSGFMAGIPVKRPRPVLEFSPERFEHFHAFFRDAIWVYIERLDVFAQAVSMYLAEATDVWERLPGAPNAFLQPSKSAPYDRALLKGHLYKFLKERRGWHRFFEYHNIATVQITYEDAVAGYPHYLFELLARAGVHAQPPYPERRTLKLGDGRNDRFAAQLRDDVLTELIESCDTMIGAPEGPRTIRGWPTVSAFAADISDDAKLTRETCRVCFITKEFHGLFRNGGIGTANTSLAFALIEAGFEVTVALADANGSGPRPKVGNFAELRDHYATRRLTLDFVPVDQAIPTAFDDPRSASYRVLLYLQRGNFDLVLFNDNGALAYYSLLAKRAGAFESAPTMCVVAHGPFDWVHELNALEYYSRLPVMTGFMERQCARMADVLISPSRYMIEWMRDRGWLLPANTRVIQNLVGVGASEARGSASGRQRIKEIVFFGRLEVRKGVELFCDAIDLLQRTTSLQGMRITCLGKFTQVAGIHSGVYMVERARAWQASLRLRSQCDQREALAYLRQTGALAVVPSPAENSPCVVLECLQLGIPFLATDTGGTAELVAPQDRAACLFPPDPTALAGRLRAVLLDGHDPARPAVQQDAVRSEWLTLVTTCGKRHHRQDLAEPVVSPKRPLVSVCVATEPSAIRRCLTSVLRQTYPQLEVLLCDTNNLALPALLPSSEEDQLKLPPIRVVAPATGSRGGARNEAARHARGDYLLFVDETSVALLPGCLERLVDAAVRTGAEILTCLQVAAPDATPPAPLAELFPIGSCTALGVLENCFGGGAILVRAEAFRSGQGFAEDCDDSVLDWQYLASASLNGSSLEVVPLPLFERCDGTRSSLDAGHLVVNHRRILRTYQGESVETVKDILEPLLDITRRNRERTERALVGIGQVTADIVRRLSTLNPASADANRAFCEYLCERRMVDTAIDFAFHTDFCLPETIANAAPVDATAAIQTTENGADSISAPT